MTDITNKPTEITKYGDFTLKVTLGGGSATLQWDVDNTGFEDIVGGAYTSDASDLISLPSCSIQAVCTGGATVYLNRAGK